MSDDLKGTVQRFYDELNKGNLDIIDEVLSEDFVDHEEFPGLEPNREGVKQFFAMFRAAFPDLRMEADDMVAEGDRVVARLTARGTHQGDFMGMPPSGKAVEVAVYDMLRFEDGKVAEHWGLFDAMTMMQQLGAIPEQAPA
ncbi:MAG TPA: ester cyclase [Thermoleophilaceae bacterium]|jgi:steroid delta-isomerase-like uncharacterized protein